MQPTFNNAAGLVTSHHFRLWHQTDKAGRSNDVRCLGVDRKSPANGQTDANDPFRTCVPSPNRLSELLSRAAQDVTQVRERAPGSFTAIPLKTRQTPRSWHISSACCGAWSSRCSC
jgi:hypothetical protein